MNDAAAQCIDLSSGPECIDLSLSTSSDDEDAQRAVPVSALAQARANTIDKDHAKRQQENIKPGLMIPHPGPETKHYLGGYWFMAEVVANATGNYQLQMTRAAPSMHFLPLLLAALPGKCI